MLASCARRQLQTLLSKINAGEIRSPRPGEAAYKAAQQKIEEQSALVELLDKELHAARDTGRMQIEQISAQLQREQLERSMAEGALESGRKDIARLMREMAALQYRPLPAAVSAAPQASPDRLRSAA